MIENDPGKFVNAIFKRYFTAQNRLNPGLPRFEIFFCFLATVISLLGLPVTIFAATSLAGSAQEMAGKIAAALPGKDTVSIATYNLSSMEPADVAMVAHAIETELLARGIHTQAPDTVGTRIVITFSESVSGLVWTAEVHQGDSSKVVLLSVPRPVPAPNGSGGNAMVLRADKFWAGPERVLDAAQFPLANGEQDLALLRPDELSMTTASAHASIEMPLDAARTNLRTLTGRIYRYDSQLTIQIGATTCTVLLDAAAIQECHSAPVLAGRTPLPNHGDQSALVHNPCGGAIQVLATGTGDDSQPDTIQAFDDQGGAPVPSSNELTFLGPVLALHEFVDAPRTTVTAIVRNLGNGNYEAYHLSTSCSK